MSEAAQQAAATAFNKLSDKEKWDQWRTVRGTWYCPKCWEIVSDGPQRPPPFHRATVHCGTCSHTLSRRTGGGQNDPFHWQFVEAAEPTLVELLDDMLDGAPLDFWGTGTQETAAMEEASWNAAVARVRTAAAARDERIAKSEAELDTAIKSLDANWVTHQELVAANKRIAELEGMVSTVPCCACGGQVIEFTVPNDVWNQIIRKGGHEHDQEYLCAACFARQCTEFVQEQLSPLAGEVQRLRIKCGPDEMIEGDYATLLQAEEKIEQLEYSLDAMLREKLPPDETEGDGP